MVDNTRQDPPATLGDAFAHGMQMGLELNAAKGKLREDIAHRIKELRLRNKMTQEDLAKRINTNFLTYRGYENCKSDIPLVLLIRIADVFGVTLDYVVGREVAGAEQESKDDLEQRIAQLEKIVAALTQK